MFDSIEAVTDLYLWLTNRYSQSATTPSQHPTLAQPHGQLSQHTVQDSIILKHAVILQGLEGSGKSTVQSALGLPTSRVLSIDDRFLTTPQIYSDDYRNPNRPADYGDDDINTDVWRYGGRGAVHPRWTAISRRTQAIMFVVDSSDRNRINAANHTPTTTPLTESFVTGYESKSKDEQVEMLATLKRKMTAKSLLKTLLHELSLSAAPRLPILVLATKQDVEGAMCVDDICDALDLKSISNRDWHLAGINAINGEGLQEAIDWLNYVVECPTNFSVNHEQFPKKVRKADRQQHFARATQIAKQSERSKAKLSQAAAPQGFRSKECIVSTQETHLQSATSLKHAHTSLGSTSLALPHHRDIHVAPQVLRRKHWFSLQWEMKDDANYGTQDIHRIYWWD